MTPHNHRQLMLCLCAILFAFAACPARSSGTTVRLLNSKPGAFHARMELVEGACCSIDIATYSLHDDATSTLLMEKLIQARGRNVRIRILVDGLMDSLSHNMFERLTSAGVCIREFHPLGPVPKRFPGFRNHTKLMIVDASAMITGGRNIGDAYFVPGADDDFIDRDIVIGDCPAVSSACCCFENLWTSELSRDVHRPTCANRCRKILSYVSCPWPSGYSSDRCAAMRQNHYCACDVTMSVDPDTICFVQSSPSETEACRDISSSLLSLVKAARHRIVIETPYVTLSKEFRDTLEKKVECGIPVLLVTNSLRSTNHVVAYAGYMRQKRMLRRLGIQIREYTGPGTLHAKNWVVDGSVFIGSYNLNSRSRHYDCECGVIIHDAQLAVATLRCMQQHELSSCRCCDEDCLQHNDWTGSGLRPLQLLLMQPVVPLIARHL
jgi:putative cardiolipin synthase